MLLVIPQVLDGPGLAEARRLCSAAPWADGKATAGYQSALAKRNLQLAEDGEPARALQALVLAALARHPRFQISALPLRIYPPLFNRYDVGMGFGDHIDNAIRMPPGSRGAPIRTDISATLALSGGDEYDGGDLVIEDAYGSHRVRLAAGDLVLYPASSVHRVERVTRGSRMGCFFWIESMVRDDACRTLLHDLDSALGGLRARGLAGEAEMVMLTGIYHNLLRRWAET